MKGLFRETVLLGLLIADAAYHGGSLGIEPIIWFAVGWLLGGAIGCWADLRKKRKEQQELRRREILSGWLN